MRSSWYSGPLQAGVVAALLATTGTGARAETTDWSPWGWQKGQLEFRGDSDGVIAEPLYPGTLCATVLGSSSSDRTPIVADTCNTGVGSNLVFTRAGELRVDPRIRSDGCLDVTGGSSQDGTPVQEWWCNGTNAQHWSAMGTIRVGHPDPARPGVIQKCLTRPDDSAYGRPYISSCWPEPWATLPLNRLQQWSYDPATGLIHPYDQPLDCLTVQDRTASYQSPITLMPCAYYGPISFVTLQHQQWVPGAGGFQSALDLGMCLDVQWGSWDDGTRLHLWGCNGTDAQTWMVDGSIIGTGSKCLFYDGGQRALIMGTCTERTGLTDHWRLWMPEEAAH